MTISFAFLAPDLVKAAIDGRLPRGMGVARLADLPAEWSKQHQMLRPPKSAQAETAPPGGVLPSWNDGPAKQAVIDLVRATTDQASPKFVPPDDRVAQFDQDGTLWVEHPIYTQFMYCIDRVGALMKEKPALKDREPFKTVLSGDHEAIAKLSTRDLFEIVLATQSWMTVEEIQCRRERVADHGQTSPLETPLHRTGLSTDVGGSYLLAGQRLQDLHRDRRQHRLCARVFQAGYGIPPEQVAGTTQAFKYGYDKDHLPILTREPKLVLDNLEAGSSRTFG